MAIKTAANGVFTSSSARNDKGTIRYGGTIAQSTKWSSKSLGDTASARSSLPSFGMTGLAKALSGGTFATMTKGSYIIRKITTTIAGVANTTLQSGASDFGFRLAIAKTEHARNTFLSGLAWVANRDGMPVYTATKSNTNTTFSNDESARPTLALPGELVYMVGITPTMVDYKAKKNG